MSILTDWKLRKYNARQHLLSIYRQLREVLLSDLHLNEKWHLFEKTHRNDVRDYSWLVRPDLYAIESHDFKAPSHSCESDRCTRCSPLRSVSDLRPAMLNAYLNELDEMLGYTGQLIELVSAVNDVAAVMEMDLPITMEGNQKRCLPRKEEFKKHVPRLEAAFDALRLKPNMEVRAPFTGYFWDCYSHQEWVKALLSCVERA